MALTFVVLINCIAVSKSDLILDLDVLYEQTVSIDKDEAKSGNTEAVLIIAIIVVSVDSTPLIWSFVLLGSFEERNDLNEKQPLFRH